VLASGVCEHSVARILFPSHYKHPTTAPKCSSRYALLFPNISVCCSASLSSAGCQKGSSVESHSPLPCLRGPALDGGQPWCPLGLRISGRLFARALALETRSELTAKRHLLCRESLSSPTTSFPPAGLTGSWDCQSRGC